MSSSRLTAHIPAGAPPAADVDAWRALAERWGSPFATPEWAEASLHGGGRARPATVLVHAGDRLVGVLPLVRHTRAGLTVLRFPGDDLGDTFPLLTAEDADERAVAATAGRALAAEPEWQAMLLFGAEGDAPWVEHLAMAAGCVVRDRGDLLRPGVPHAEGGWEGLLAGMKRTNRKETRRLLRRTEELEDCAFTAAEAGQASQAMATLFRLHDLRWDGKGGSSIGAGDARDRLTRFALASAQRGWLRLWTLRVGDRPVAAELAWRVGDRQTHYQGGFDPEFSRMGVGIAAFAHAMRAGLEEGVRDLDLGQGESGYKLRFSTATRRSRRVVLTRRHHPAGAVTQAALAARRLAQRLPEGEGSGLRGRLSGLLHAVRARGTAEHAQDGAGDV